MAQNYANVSLLTTGATDAGGARNFSYLRVLNTDIFTGGGGGTVTGSFYTFANSNNVSWTTTGGSVVASASYQTFSQSVQVRGSRWEDLGVMVSAGSPTNPCQYTDWTSGSSGFWGWIELP